LATTLQKNLLSLEKYMPSAYEAFKNYKEKLGDAKAIENAGAKAWLLA
jgi:hypothetical protein